MYCKEFNDWTGANEEVSFSIKEVSANLMPTQTNDNFKCDGLEFIGFYKGEDGMLFLKMKSDNADGYELVTFPNLKSKYNTHQ
jgi:hypothetical protein